MDAVTKIVNEIYRPSCGFSLRNVENWVERVANAADEAGYTICDLKPLTAKFKNCRPYVADIAECIEDSQRRGRNMLTSVAQALNWERTEFDTLDELLGEIREQEQAHSNFVDQALAHYDLTDVVREKLCLLAETLGSTPLLDEAIELMAPRRYDDGPATTHTLLHAGELYREVTILLHTEQLVAWRTADGQEYSSPAHRVTLDPDEDGLAAAILSRIAGVEIAPEHMAELRAQMAGGVAHG